MSIPKSISEYLRAYGKELSQKVLISVHPLHSPASGLAGVEAVEA
jgi:hypothetical protein